MLAFGQISISPREFYELTYADFLYLCEGFKRREENKWRHTRYITAAIVKKDPRQLMELPGDYDHLKGLNERDVSALINILENGRSKS